MIINVSYFDKQLFLDEVNFPYSTKIHWRDRDYMFFSEFKDVEIDDDKVFKEYQEVHYYLCDDDIFLKLKLGDNLIPHDHYHSLNSIIEREKSYREVKKDITTVSAWIYLIRELQIHQLK